MNFERIAHLQDRIDLRARRPARRGLDDRRSSASTGPTRSTTSPPSPSCRPRSASRCSPARSPPSASPACSTPSASSTPTSASTRPARSEMFGKVQEVPQTETTPVLPPQPVRRGQGLRPLDHGQLPRVATTCTPSSGILFNHESPRRGLEFVTRKISHTRGPDQARAAERAAARQPRRPARLGLRRRLRRGHVADAAAGRARRLRRRHRRDPLGAGVLRDRLRPRRPGLGGLRGHRRGASSAPPRSTCSSATRPRPEASSAGSRAPSTSRTW